MATRNQTIEFTSTLVTETCCNCGVLFAMPDDLRATCWREKERRTFYCPNGHGQSYLGKTEKQLREEAERRAANAEEEARIQVARAMKAEREAARLKREQAAAKRRAKAALCPVPGCQRSIIQMRRHLETKHPDFVLSPEQALKLAEAHITATRQAEVLARHAEHAREG